MTPETTWPWASVDGVDELGVVDSAQVSRCDCEVGMLELSLDHDQQDPLAGHLDGVRVPQLVWREARALTLDLASLTVRPGAFERGGGGVGG
jgi:hypothetical protein